MIGYYDYTVWLTYLGFISGVLGIINAFGGHSFVAIICLMFSGLCDMFDGKVARTKEKRTKDEKTFGMQIDSLSDLVCFGVLPAAITFGLGMNRIYFFTIIIFYPLAALIRLAYFNMLEINRNSDSPVKFYTGLPVTSSALIFPFIYIFRNFLGKYFILIYGLTLLIVGLLFISKIKIKKPRIKTMILFILLGVVEIILIITIKKFL
jgi:CDP-diacylglycerol---serine O-phosphatidyltransferase